MTLCMFCSTVLKKPAKYTIICLEIKYIYLPETPKIYRFYNDKMDAFSMGK